MTRLTQSERRDQMLATIPGEIEEIQERLQDLECQQDNPEVADAVQGFRYVLWELLKVMEVITTHTDQPKTERTLLMESLQAGVEQPPRPNVPTDGWQEIFALSNQLETITQMLKLVQSIVAQTPTYGTSSMEVRMDEAAKIPGLLAEQTKLTEEMNTLLNGRTYGDILDSRMREQKTGTDGVVH